jgi:hypothetical protein
MNRQERRVNLSLARSHLRKVNRNLSDDFVQLTRENWPHDTEPTRFAVFRSNRFLVQAFNENGGVIRLSICRTTVDAAGNWLAHITWDELQKIKNGVGYSEQDAVEVYPRDRDVVNVSNMRHLWIMPEYLKFAWRNVTHVSGEGLCL